MPGSISQPDPPMADSFFSGAFGPKTSVTLIAERLSGAPREADLWASWERRCLYVGEVPLDDDQQRWPQWLREPYPAMHAAHAVRIDKRPIIEVARTYPSPVQRDDRHDRTRDGKPPVERGRTAERLTRRGDRLWALLGAWPWACPSVRDRAIAEELPLKWTWDSEELSLIACRSRLRGALVVLPGDEFAALDDPRWKSHWQAPIPAQP